MRMLRLMSLILQVLEKQQIIRENAIKQCKDEATIQVKSTLLSSCLFSIKYVTVERYLTKLRSQKSL